MSVQGDLLNLLLDRKVSSASPSAVSHNLNVAPRHGRTVVILGESRAAPTRDLFAAAHPAALLSTNPVIDPAKRKPRIVLQGEIPSVVDPPSGCRFHTRCAQAEPRCAGERPMLREIGPERSVRCHYPLIADIGAHKDG